MKFSYFNLLLFSVPLNILINDHSKYSSCKHTSNSKTTKPHRSLCECELYSPANYDNDAEMKRVMQQFEDRTSQRFHEYDERMQSKRMQCKEQCDREIKKIILKDKLEKELTEKFATLHTDIQSNAIPTCICEKSMADKMEKGCLRCGGVFGGIAPSVGLLGGIGEAAISVLKPLAIEAAKKAAVTEATDLATQAGMNAVSLKIEKLATVFTERDGFVDLSSIVTSSTYNNGPALLQSAKELIGDACKVPGKDSTTSFYNSITYSGESNIEGFAQAGRTAYNETLPLQKALLEKAKVGAVEATYGGYHISIIASIVAIVVIVLIMVIIYLILRYRRKKKMKKKLQYIKLLEE
ncbi:rifin [Plasmodium falciparum IGH-CR14]|uniref:Rifin n=1 Tax=Plasmodium falciparum IGH-CR14 TaxID=580059 RepID=A0A0L1I4Q5_PLAFA|nr:rifin [Plasmodium falciparum IGH-CR14]